MSETDLNKILRWGAGAGVDVSGIETVDTERLLKLISRHKLQVRFFERAKAERPPWYTRALSIALWQFARDVRAQTERQIAALCEITAALPPEAGPPILIKGFTAYALTRNENAVRPAGDLDLFFPDLDEAKETLLGLGYADLEAHDILHEATKMVRNDTLLELDYYFPVCAYPIDMDLSGPSAGKPGWSTQTTEPIRLASKIEYAHLRDNAVQIVTADSAGYWVADSHMAALTICTHIFRDYTERGGFQLTTPIPLAEIADVRGLIQLPGFDSVQFLALTEKFQAQHSVEMVGRLLQACFGQSDLSLPMPSSAFEAQSVFPQCLNPQIGIWTVLGSLAGLPMRRMHEAFNGLGGANTILVGEENSKVYATGGALGDEMVRNVLTRRRLGKSLPILFSAAWTVTALCLEVRMPPIMPGESDLITLNFGGGDNFDWQYWADGTTKEKCFGVLQGLASASVTGSPDGYAVHLRLLWPSPAGTAEQNQQLLLMLEADRRKEGQPGVSSIFVPLRLIRG